MKETFPFEICLTTGTSLPKICDRKDCSSFAAKSVVCGASGATTISVSTAVATAVFFFPI